MSWQIMVGGLLLLLILFIGSLWARGRRVKAELAAKYPAPGQMVDVGGYRLHIRCEGEGSPAVVIEAALGDFTLAWEHVQREVAKFTRVCAYDRAGLGWSDRSPKARVAENCVAELHTLLTQAGVEPPYVLVGHSVGGPYVRLYTHRYPDQVAGLVLVDTSHEDQGQRFPETFRRVSERRRAQMPRLMRILGLLNSIGFLALNRERLPASLLASVPEENREAFLAVITRDNRWLRTMAEEFSSSEETLATLRALPDRTLGDLPLAVLTAGQRIPEDQIPAFERLGLSAEDVQQVEAAWRGMQADLAALSSRGSQAIAEESSHLLQVEQPELVIEAIRQVVEAVRTS